MSTVETTATPRTARQLIAELEGLGGRPCPACGGRMCSHEVLMCIAMGFKNAPRCLRCLAQALAREPEPLADQLYHYLQRQECHRTAWEWANTTEGFGRTSRPGCLFPADGSPLGAQFQAEAGAEDAADPFPPGAGAAEPPPHQAEWDAGEMACGELVLELRFRLQALPAGDVFRLCARDAGVPEDLPAWCRLTGHRLRRAEPPNYWIQRKE